MRFREYFNRLGICALFSQARALVDENERLQTALDEKDGQVSVIESDYRSERKEFIDRLMDARNYQRIHQKPVPRETTQQQGLDNPLMDYDRVYDDQLRKQTELELYEESMMRKAEAEFDKDINQIVNS